MKLIALTAPLLLAGLASSAALAARPAAKGEQKVQICHATHVKKHPYVLISVPVSSVRGRLRQGDVMPANGRCAPAAPASTTATSTTTTTTSA
jgi:hypothetical protein